MTVRDDTFNFGMAEEGGYDADVNDAGCWSSNQCGVGHLIGSNLGVTATDLIKYLAPKNVTAADMKALTRDTAEAIWAPHYWQAMSADDLPPSVAFCAVDFGYNAGVGTSGRILQRLVGADPDGWVGPATIASVNAWSDFPKISPTAAKILQAATGVQADGIVGQITVGAAKGHSDWVLVALMSDAQAAYYRSLDQFPLYGNGWLSRTWRRCAAAMATK